MGKIHSEIDDAMRQFVERQHLFFVATAPASLDGHVNCSPKGLDTPRILGPTTVAYLDYTGSGAETIAHVRENGRIVIMLCAFEGAPKIVRFHGKGEVIEPGDADFATLIAHFDPGPGVRSIIRIDVDRISDSCGFGVPLLRFEDDRTASGARGEEGKRRTRNVQAAAERRQHRRHPGAAAVATTSSAVPRRGRAVRA